MALRYNEDRKGGESTDFLLEGIRVVTWQQLIMYVVGVVLIWLVINKEYEPSLLLSMGFGAIMVNLPMNGISDQLVQGKVPATGIIQWFYKVGIESLEMMPLLFFIGIGVIIGFRPLPSQPFYFPLDAAAQFGVFAVIFVATLLGSDLKDTASISITGAADGPTSILVSQVLDSAYIRPIVAAAYSYMVLVPIIQSSTIKLATTKKERQICMSHNAETIPKFTQTAFPIAITMIIGLTSPQSVALADFLMLGNLPHKCGVLNALSQTVQDQLTNLVTLPLGIMIPLSMRAEQFVNLQTLMTLVLGLVIFVFDTMADVLLTKLVNMALVILHKPLINPVIDGCGISAFPMSSCAVQKLTNEEQKSNTTLMQAAGANAVGQVTSVIVGGLVINIVSQYL